MRERRHPFHDTAGADASDPRLGESADPSPAFVRRTAEALGRAAQAASKSGDAVLAADAHALWAEWAVNTDDEEVTHG